MDHCCCRVNGYGRWSWWKEQGLSTKELEDLRSKHWSGRRVTPPVSLDAERIMWNAWSNIRKTMGNLHCSRGCKYHCPLHLMHCLFWTSFQFSVLLHAHFALLILTPVSREEATRAKMRFQRVTSKDQPFLSKRKFADLLGNRMCILQVIQYIFTRL